MIYKDVEIDPDDIKAVTPRLNQVLLVPRRCYSELASNLTDQSLRFYIQVKDIDNESLKMFKFEHLRYLKTLPNPEDRVADFEVEDENGIIDFKKFDRFVEMSKTRAEKQIETNELIELIQLCIDDDIECEDLKEALKQKMLGG